MKWYTDMKKRTLRNNRGSAIVSVLVTMTFVVVLGSILLYLSLVNMQMKVIDREGKENFYDAESAMNEIRVGIQGAVSDAINGAYTSVLVKYNEYVDADDRVAEFQANYYDELYAWKPDPDRLEKLFNEILETYDTDVLSGFVTAPAGTTNITGGGTIYKSDDESFIVLENVIVTYTDKGYETTVSADIKINTPNFLYKSTTAIQTGVPDFAIIAQNRLLVRKQNVSVEGSVYAGEVEIITGNSLSIGNAPNFISAGDIIVGNSASMSSDADATWAGDIILENDASITLGNDSGDMLDTYVANDLNLLGNSASATLYGRYFGYGNDVLEPDRSSSIIVNGKETTLDMSGLTTLFLAGHSFVNYPNGDVLMGQSIAVKSDQLAYLIPENCLSGFSNPHLLAEDMGNEFYQGKVNLTVPVITSAVTGDKFFADYGINDSSDIQVMRKTVGDTHLVYFLMKFPTPQDANNYFKDYFSAHSDEIQKYLSIYSGNGITLYEDSTQSLAGQGYYTEGGILQSIEDTTFPQQATIDAITESFTNLCRTLSRTNEGDGSDSPYAYYVNNAQIESAVDGVELYYHDGVAKIIVTDGTYTIDNDTASSVHVVIATGKVVVRRNFTGLIISGTKIVLRANVTADRDVVADALQALEITVGEGDTAHKEYMYLNPAHILPLNITSNAGGATGGWNMNTLVTYENWSKNES